MYNTESAEQNPVQKLRIQYIARKRSQIEPDGPLARAFNEFGDFVQVEHGHELSDEDAIRLMRQTDVLVTSWNARPIPRELARDPGKLRYVLNLSGTCRATIPPEIIQCGIDVTNWGDTPAIPMGEGAMTLLLAVLKDLRGRNNSIERGENKSARALGLRSGSLYGLNVGLFGCGVIGRHFAKLIRPFQPQLHVLDPYVENLPDGCSRVPDLDRLFEVSEAVVIAAGLTDETYQSVTAERLARLPDQGIVINVGRAEIVHESALFSELRSGRLRAGLDVYGTNDCLPDDSEARSWPNLLLTAHDINSTHWPERPAELGYADKVAVDNISRFKEGEQLKFRIDERRYALMS